MLLNSITTSRNEKGTILFCSYGAEANTLMLNKRQRLIECVENGGNNRYFVLEGEIVRAAQSTEESAMQYMQSGYVLLDAGEKRYTVCVQGEDASSGECGDFIARVDADGKRRAVSPIFMSLALLFPWMHENGWEMQEYINGEFIPWRAIKV